MRQIFITLFALFILSTPVLAANDIATLEKELQALEQELSAILKEGTDLDTRQNYVKRVLTLREKIEALEGEENQSEGFYYKLVEIKNTMEPQGEKKHGKAVVRFKFDEETTTFSWTKDVTADKYNYIEKQSFGFEEYPEKIFLGEPYTIKASAISQKDIYPGYCWTTDEQELSNGLDISAGWGNSKAIQGIPYSISDCKSSKSLQTVHAGGRIDIVVRCESDKPKYFGLQGGYLYYDYKCKITSSETPGQWKSTAGQPLKIYVKKDAYDKPIRNKDGGYILAPPKEGSEPSKIHYDISLGGSYVYVLDSAPVQLVYKPVYTKDDPLENTATVQHTVQVNNSVEQGEEPQVEETEDLARKDRDPDNSQEDGRREDDQHGTPDQETATQTVAREKQRKQRQKHIKDWLEHAEPVENAQAGYYLKYDEWGRVQGKTSNGSISLAKPDSAGLSPADYAWVRADTIDSLNLCTLKEYVERKLANKDTAICRKNIPRQQADKNIVPNFVGMEAAKAKTDLNKLGVKIKWKAGSIAKTTAQQGLVEKQNPKTGSTLKGIKQVELWVYRYATPTVKVPNVVGMMYRDAWTKLKKAGLKPSVGKTSSPLTLNPRQKVLEQETTAGAKVPKGETVVLNFSKEGFKMPLTLSNRNRKVQPLPDVLSREQYKMARTPNVVGMYYEQAARKLKSKGLKPVYKRGIHPPDRLRAKTVMSTSPNANTLLKVGTEIIVTVYDSYRQPASTAKGKLPTDRPEADNMNWAGMWHVTGKYDMELLVSGNNVTGRYGRKMENTIEGKISGNILRGWWKEGKSGGRFENKIRDNGNYWKGVWNTGGKPGKWNGGWSAKRIGKKKDPVRSSTRSTFNCDTGIPGLQVESSGRKNRNRKNGVLKTDVNGEKNYICRYKIKGRQRIAVISFFDKPPANAKARKLMERMCTSFGSWRHTRGKVVSIFLGTSSLKHYIKSRVHVDRFLKFHMDQVTPQAVSCSGNGRSGKSGNTGITINQSRQKLQRGSSSNSSRQKSRGRSSSGLGSSCHWDGGHDIFGVPGMEVRVYCKCNGKIANDRRCSGPKPKGNHYYGK